MINPDPRAVAPLVLVGALASILLFSNVPDAPTPMACPGWIEGTDSVMHPVPHMVINMPTSTSDSNTTRA